MTTTTLFVVDDRNPTGLAYRPLPISLPLVAKDSRSRVLQKRLEQREQARRAQGELTRWDRNRNGLLDP